MLTARQQIFEADARQTVNPVSALTSGTANPSTPIGTIAETPDLRTWEWSLAGATSLLAGKLTTGPATTANHVNQTGTANAVGATTLTYTVGATAATQDQYKHGYFAINVGPGQNLYKIRGNTVVASGGGSISVSIGDDGIDVATTTSSKFSLYPHLFYQTVITTAAATQPCSGVPNVPVTNGYYYWSQVGGMASVLSDGVIGKNSGAIVSASVNGAATVEGSSAVTQRIGYAPEATVDTTYLPIVLTLRG
jgi:hypothetical protein